MITYWMLLLFVVINTFCFRPTHCLFRHPSLGEGLGGLFSLLVITLKFLHAGDEGIAAFDGLGVVARSTEASD